MQKTPSLNAFIFDLGKVIVDWNPGYLLHEITADEAELKFLVEEVLDLEWFRAVDAGYPLSKAIAERSEIYPEYATAMQLYVDRWPETIRGLAPVPGFAPKYVLLKICLQFVENMF